MNPNHRPYADRRWHRAMAACFLAVASIVPVRAVGPSLDLTKEHLEEAGLHLPSYVENLRQFMDFQDRLPIHQELDIEWDSIPGTTSPVPKSELRGTVPAPNFTISKRYHKLPGGAGKSFTVGDESLIIVGVTANNQVDSVSIQIDPRAHHSEDFSGPRPIRTDAIIPKATIHLALPDDPQIKKILFFLPAKGGDDGGWKLQSAGALDLPPI